MKKEQWFISNPDEYQLKVINTELSENLAVVGAAGSGKTNLTLYKAKQADAQGDSWGIIVASRAMSRMISYGLDAIGLNGERVTYSWAWTNRGGFDLRGDLYWEKGYPANIFLVKGNEVSRFRRFDKGYNIKGLDENALQYVVISWDHVDSNIISCKGSVLSLMGKDIINPQLYKVKSENQDIFFCIDENEIYTIKAEDARCITNNCSSVDIMHPIPIELSREGKKGIVELPLFEIESMDQEYFLLIDGGYIYLILKKDGEYTIDFPDWVNAGYYYMFGRRSSKYIRINSKQGEFDLKGYTLFDTPIVLTRHEENIDHILVDEAQDLKIGEYTRRYVPRAGKSIVFFGDDNQRITSGSRMSFIKEIFGADMLALNYNYRVPKSIARFAQSIMNTDLISNNMKEGGDSDYPKYPKPTLEWYPTLKDILDAIVAQVRLEDLKDVAILIPSSNTGGDKDSCRLLSSWLPEGALDPDIRRHYRTSDIQCIVAYLNKNIGIDVMTFYRTGSEAPFNTIDTLDFTNNDLISLLSIDDAKGSEFSHVFVILPSCAKGEMQNEMSYVACTRATESLHLFYYGDYEPALISKQEGSTYNLLDVRSKRPNDYVKPSMYHEDGSIQCLDILYFQNCLDPDRGKLYLPGDKLTEIERL